MKFSYKINTLAVNTEHVLQPVPSINHFVCNPDGTYALLDFVSDANETDKQN